MKFFDLSYNAIIFVFRACYWTLSTMLICYLGDKGGVLLKTIAILINICSFPIIYLYLEDFIAYIHLRVFEFIRKK
jgi:hypothetical protein